MIKKLICKWFGHRWTDWCAKIEMMGCYEVKDWTRQCKRCKRKEISIDKKSFNYAEKMLKNL